MSTWLEERIQRGSEHTANMNLEKGIKGVEGPVFRQREGRVSEFSRGVKQCVCVQRN